MRALGVELVEAAIFLDTLHPVRESEGFYWEASKSLDARQREFLRDDSEDNAQQWRSSPFHHMLENGLSELHLPLAGEVPDQFPVLAELKQAGHTGYFAQIIPLGGNDAIGEMDNLYCRWSTDRPGGFRREDLDAFRRLVPALTLAIKSAALRQLVEVYLGHDAGKRVLEGRIARGRVESIHTVLWYSDMANYTSLSETVHSSELIAMLNDYAEATISGIHHCGGDVLKLIGDGVLAIFNRTDAKEAADAALQARRRLAENLSLLNERRRGLGLATTSIYLGLHFGEVFYGNIGSDERLDFTVIGPAVNEVCRIAASSRALGRSLLVSENFRALLAERDAEFLADVGTFQLKGVRNPRRLYAPQD
ncbi:adenylate/guanylate cyclase domain-containing protein [Sinorhizobium americanum]|uniref:adenylate/guanylate cyclase domain-containing protein n=1 Tax=Sinorhizobium americanum TaxID=194963 RepID=UPI001404FF33|nr:adenylate/guanylate cyclase domain-containing protein [Sinorhizobium americanum]